VGKDLINIEIIIISRFAFYSTSSLIAGDLSFKLK